MHYWSAYFQRKKCMTWGSLVRETEENEAVGQKACTQWTKLLYWKCRDLGKKQSQLNHKLGILSVRTFFIKRGINQTERATRQSCKQKVCSWRGKVIKGPFVNARYTKPARESTGLTYNWDKKYSKKINKTEAFCICCHWRNQGRLSSFSPHKASEVVLIKPKLTVGSYQSKMVFTQEFWKAKG